MRVTILWKQMSSYFRAAFAALEDRGVEVALVHPDTLPDAPYDDKLFDVGSTRTVWSGHPDEAAVRRDIDAFGPDAVLVCSWDVGAYRRVSRSLAGKTLRILCMDNAWLGTAKQWGGRAISPFVIRPTFDAAFVPGERQAEFARRLGFADERILWGLNTCDFAAFDAVGARRSGEPPAAFLYVGRLAPEKGLDVLLDAYRTYRDAVRDPWPLLVCGAGPLERRLREVPGVELVGFVQPPDLPGVFERAGCLVLPSRFEPWGVVIHEAAAAGLAVVCSTACGASTRLVADGYNGEVVPPGNRAALARALGRVSAPGADRAGMSRRSRELAAQFTPERWAGYVVDRCTDLRRQLGLDPA